MPLNDHIIQLGNLEHSIDWQRASRSIRVPKGKIVVEMLPERGNESRYTIALPDNVAENLRSDVGVVIGSHGFWTHDDFISYPEFIKNTFVECPSLGSLVCVAPYDGTWIEGAEMGDYAPQGQVRVYGAFLADDNEPAPYNWWDSVLCEIEGGGMFNPCGDKVIFRLDPMTETEGGIILSDYSKYRTGMATVEAAGPLAFDVKPGDRVCIDVDKLLSGGLSLGDKDLAIGTELCINYALVAA